MFPRLDAVTQPTALGTFKTEKHQVTLADVNRLVTNTVLLKDSVASFDILLFTLLERLALSVVNDNTIRRTVLNSHKHCSINPCCALTSNQTLTLVVH